MAVAADLFGDAGDFGGQGQLVSAQVLEQLGIAGFVLSLVGAVLAISNLGGLMKSMISKASSPSKGPKGGKKWSSKFEERWDRRNFDE